MLEILIVISFYLVVTISIITSAKLERESPDSHLDHRNRNRTWTKHVWPAWARKIVRSYAPERDPDYTDQPLHLSQEHLRKEHDNKSRENLSIPYDLWLTHRGMQSSNNSEARLLGTIKNLFNTLLTLHIICLNRIFKNFQFRPSILSMLHYRVIKIICFSLLSTLICS
jgi:hypothetical protein